MKLLFTLLLFLVSTVALFAQPGSLDRTFKPGKGANGSIQAIAIQSDGKILIGGDFTSYNSESINYIARLNTDGTLDKSFNPGNGPNGDISAASLQSDGKIIIGGMFEMYDTIPRNSIARLNADGSLDTSFDTGNGVEDGKVSSINIQDDGKIIITGWFSSFNGRPGENIARLNSDGSLDFSFNPGKGANYWIETSVMQNDGKILIGGEFTSYNKTSRRRLARINGN